MVWPPSIFALISYFFLLTSRLALFCVCFLTVPNASPNPGFPLSVSAAQVAPPPESHGIDLTSCPSKATSSEGTEGSALTTTSLITIFLTALITIGNAVIYFLACLSVFLSPVCHIGVWGQEPYLSSCDVSGAWHSVWHMVGAQ